MDCARHVAVVTGSAGGIGSAIVQRLEHDGWAVAGLDIVTSAGGDAAPLDSGVQTIRYRCDVTQEAAVRETAAAIDEGQGPVSLLVNNAGYGGPFHTIDQVTLEEWNEVLAVNLRGPFLLCRELLPRMAARSGGRVINIASLQGIRGAAKSSTYATSKHALVGMTRSLALEWGGRNITVNAICPGYVATAMGLRDEENPGITEQAMARIPARRQASPEEVAGLVSYLARDEAAYVNGAVLTMDGGFSAG